MKSWPEEAKAAVCLTGDVDSPHDVADGRLDRILEVLDDFRVKYTFPITAQVFLENVDSIRPIIDHARAHGDEIAGHGDVHKGFRGQTYAAQKTRMEEMIKVIRELSGIRINGFRAPLIRGDIITSKVAHDLGLSYDSSLWINEVGWLNLGGKLIRIRGEKLRRLLINFVKLVKTSKRVSIKRVGTFSERDVRARDVLDCFPFNPIFEGRKLDILSIPVSNMDDDLIINITKIRNWKKMAKIWQINFEDRYNDGGLYVLLAHPLLTGRKEYIKALRSFIEYAIDKEDVWFATLTELAQWWVSLKSSVQAESPLQRI